VPDRKLVCPHCGHDGSPESAKSPLESFGFNYLEDDVVCREVRGFDADGRLLIDRDPRTAGSLGSNPRLECRSCWQSFTLPAEVERAVAPADSSETHAAEKQPDVVPVESSGVPPAGGEASRRVAEKLADFLDATLNEIRETLASDLRRIESAVSSVTEELPGLHDHLGAVRLHGDGLADEQRQLDTKVADLEARFRVYEDGVPPLREEVRSVAGGQTDLREKMETQSKLLLAVEDGLARLEQLWHQQREAMDQYANSVGTEFAALKLRSDALDRHLADEAEKAERLGVTWKGLRESMEAVSSRLDTQAAAIRSLHLSVEAQVRQREELRATLQKLEALAHAADTPNPLPENL
jgi:archaellum component FlaC